MNLSADLDQLLRRFTSEIDLVREFVSETERSLSRRPKKRKFSPEQITQLKKVASALTSAVEGKGKTSLQLDEAVSDFVLALAKPIKHKGFFAEMSVTYLVSFLEAFVKDLLETVYAHQPAMLMAVKEVSFGEIQQHTSMRALKRYVAKREASRLGYESIDEIAIQFEKRMNIDFTKFRHWDELREIVYRRNIIVHNQSITNEAYCRNTGDKRRGRKLSTDPKYVINAADIIRNFVSYCHDSVKRRFVKTKKQSQS